MTEFWAKLAETCNDIEVLEYESLTGEPMDRQSTCFYTAPFWKVCGFRGETKTICGSCGKTNINHWYSASLQLPMVPGRTVALDACFARYFRAEDCRPTLKNITQPLTI